MENAEKDSSVKSLIKSRKRVIDHGEVFTPAWLVEDMLDLTEESDRIDARFLEPACGTGNFLTEVLHRKLAIVDLKSNKNRDKKLLSLVSIMSIYGIELLKDNANECRERLLNIFSSYLGVSKSDEFYRAAVNVLSLNIAHGDALKMLTSKNKPIIFAEWDYLGKGKFRRQDFRFDDLIRVSQEENKKAIPVKTYSALSLNEIAYPQLHSQRNRSL